MRRPSERRDRLVLRAGLFMIRAHGVQHRKDGRTPYFVHPVGVMRFLSSELGITNPDLLCAALLHDVLEDTPTPSSTLARQFGRRIAHIVQELTVPDDLHGPSVPDARKTEVLLRDVSRMSWEAVLVKLADRYDNLGDMAYARWGTGKRRRYRDQTVKLLAALNRRIRRETPPPQWVEPLRRARAAVQSRLAPAL